MGDPIKNTQCVTKAKGLGHIMTDGDNLNESIIDTLTKANIEWGMLRNKILGNVT